MGKTYEVTEKDVQDKLEHVIETYHPELSACGLMVDLLWIRDEDAAHPLKVAGVPAYACVRICTLKERVAGRKDAEIIIDERRWNELGERTQIALLDHELTHLDPIRDEWDKPTFDDIHRPRLRMRKHDRTFGWFDEVAARHGKHSIEAMQAGAFFSKPEAQAYLNGVQEPQEHAGEGQGEEPGE